MTVTMAMEEYNEIQDERRRVGNEIVKAWTAALMLKIPLPTCYGRTYGNYAEALRDKASACDHVAVLDHVVRQLELLSGQAKAPKRKAE